MAALIAAVWPDLSLDPAEWAPCRGGDEQPVQQVAAAGDNTANAIPALGAGSSANAELSESPPGPTKGVKRRKKAAQSEQ
eukprot:4858274-Prymnesium_polylepis.1